MKSNRWSPDYIIVCKTNTISLPYFYEMFTRQNHRRINHDSPTNNTSFIDNHNCCRSIFWNNIMNRLLECHWREDTRTYTKKYQHHKKRRKHDGTNLQNKRKRRRRMFHRMSIFFLDKKRKKSRLRKVWNILYFSGADLVFPIWYVPLHVFQIGL